MIPLEASFSDIMSMELEMIRFGPTFSPLKITLFLDNQIWQHKCFGIVFHNRLRMGFFMRLPGKMLFQLVRSQGRVSGCLKREIMGNNMDFQACIETLHWSKRRTDDSDSELHKAHRAWPTIPLFLRFSAVSNLLCINNHIKQLNLGMQSDCQTFFHMLYVAIFVHEVNILSPSLTV